MIAYYLKYYLKNLKSRKFNNSIKEIENAGK
jgi:hypothetical protein